MEVGAFRSGWAELSSPQKRIPFICQPGQLRVVVLPEPHMSRQQRGHHCSLAPQSLQCKVFFGSTSSSPRKNTHQRLRDDESVSVCCPSAALAHPPRASAPTPWPPAAHLGNITALTVASRSAPSLSSAVRLHALAPLTSHPSSASISPVSSHPPVRLRSGTQPPQPSPPRSAPPPPGSASASASFRLASAPPRRLTLLVWQKGNE